MSTTQHTPGDGPTRKQMRLLRALANERGTTFTYPRSKAQASAEIGRLRSLPRESRRDRAIERHELEEARPASDAARVRDDEVTGYGSSARWAHSSEDES